MADIVSGIFSPNEFRNRGVLKLAPDAFISINGSLGARVVSPITKDGNQGLEVRGGITSINVSLALSPAGASKATFEVVAPQYKGLHENYYINLPNGVKMPYFAPMMEVKVYMKGRFLDEATGYKPQYYPVFWGLITDVSESYNGGMNTFSVTCEDLLVWWKYQRLTLKPSWEASLTSGPTAKKFPTVFENMSPWEIIYALFTDTFFAGGEGGGAFNFIYPKYSNTGLAPDFGKLSNEEREETFSALTQDVMKYWNQRFGFGVDVDPNDPNRAPLEMFGLQGPINIEMVKQAVSVFRTTARVDRSSSIHAKLNLDFGLMARIQPYGAFNLFGSGAQSIEASKLEIANEVCEQTHMEFFLDSNGRFVFKPPLYNMDVNSEVLPYYVFKPEDIINLNTSVNSNAICNFLEVTAPIRYEVPELENKGYHIDFDSIKKFGIRYQALSMRYGNDARTLRLVACAEMTRMNGRAYTGSLSCSLRPELRLGYPIYVKHLDSYFYVTSINHSISFGTSATTDVGLEMRRDRMWDDGTVSGIPGKLLKSKVLRFREAGNVVKWAKSLKSKRADEPVSKEQLDDFVKKLKETSDDPNSGLEDVSVLANNILKEDFKRNSGILAGPKTNGLYEISDASISFLTDNATGDAVVNNQKKTQERMNGDPDASPDEKTTDPQSAETQRIVSNELIMISDNTVPYTDLNGYKHIGAFPYGANLKLTRGSGIIDTTDPGEIAKEATDATLNAKGTQTTTDTTPKSSAPAPVLPSLFDNKEPLKPVSPSPADTTNVANATRFSNTVKTTLNASPDEWSSMEEYPVASNSKLPFEVRD